MDIIKMMFAHWNPFPPKDYCERMGWPVHTDGTVDTPGMGRVPTYELVEEADKEVEELERLYKL